MKTLRKYGSSCIVVALAVLFSPATAAACESCFGAAVDSEVTRGIGLAMLLLLLVVTTVFAGILWFFRNMWDRTRRLKDGSLVPPQHPTVLPPAALN